MYIYKRPQEYIPNCHNPVETGMGQRPQEYIPNCHNPVEAGIGQPGTNTINHLRKHHGIDREAIIYAHLPQSEPPFLGTLTFTNGPRNTYQPATSPAEAGMGQWPQEYTPNCHNPAEAGMGQRPQEHIPNCHNPAEAGMGQRPQEYIPNCHNPAEAGMGQRPQEYIPNCHNPVEAGMGQRPQEYIPNCHYPSGGRNGPAATVPIKEQQLTTLLQATQFGWWYTSRVSIIKQQVK